MKSPKALLPDQALQQLKDGNNRFLDGVRSLHSQVSALKIKELAEKGQRPFAIILSCSDSRVPSELIFDQGFGDLFVVRVAGNVTAPSLMASIEFAALNFETPLVVVMGHTHCGAIKATLEKVGFKRPVPSENLDFLTTQIEEGIAPVLADCRPEEMPQCLHEATWSNIWHSIHQLRVKSPILKDLETKEKLMIVGAMYDLETGRVDFQEQAMTSEQWPLKDLEKAALKATC